MNRSTRMLLSWLVRASLLLVALASSAVAQPHQLVENFTAALPAGNGIRAETDAADPKVGLAAARLHYAIDPKARVAALDCGGDRRTFAGPGTLKLWVKGDASGNELELALREGRLQTTPDGRQTLAVQREFNLPRLKLDFDGWREVEFNVPAAAAGGVSWLQWIRVHAAAKEPQLSGTIGLDELRLSPAAAPPNAQVAVGWIGADVREFGVPMELFLDARNFTTAPASVRARVQVTDRNDNTVATREFTGQLAANEQQEFRWDLAPENLAAFLPPFRITGDVMSPELPDLTARIDVRLVAADAPLVRPVRQLETADLDTGISALDLVVGQQLEIVHLAVLPDQERVPIGRFLRRRLPDDRPVLDAPEIRIARPAFQRLAIEERVVVAVFGGRQRGENQAASRGDRGREESGRGVHAPNQAATQSRAQAQISRPEVGQFALRTST